MLKVTMLQTPSIELDGRVISLPFKRADALLYYMLVQRSATRQELIALLWESCDEATGLKNLRNTLYTLKKALGGDLLLSPQKSMVVLNPDWDISCDYDNFTRQGDFSAYQGLFLQGFAVKRAFSFDEWLYRIREKLREQYLSELAAQARRAREAGDTDAAVRWAGEYIREEPYDEGMAAFLMECWREERQYAKVAQVYQRLKERLQEELGVPPQEETTLLYYEIMNQWNDSSTQSEETEQREAPLGRENVWAALRAAYNSFAEGAVGRCSQLLLGEVGSGKSELVKSFLGRVELENVLLLRGNCLQSEEQLPLAIWDKMILPLWHFAMEEGLTLPPVVRARLCQAFSLLHAHTETDVEDSRALRRWDMELEDSMLLLLAAIGRRKKILLLLEDVQWADEDSLRLLDALLRRLENGTCMAVLTARENLSEGRKRVLEKLERDGLLRGHRLPPLSLEQTRELLHRELGDEAEKLAEGFYRQTGGNLSLLTTLTQAYRSSHDAASTLKAAEDILMDRLRDLSEEAQRVLEMIVLFEESVPFETLLTMLGRDDRRLCAGLEELRALGIIEEVQGGGNSYRFIHRRLQELSYERMPLRSRQELHRQAAEALKADGRTGEGRDCRRIARHYALAGDSLHDLQYRIRALDLDSARRCEPFSPFGGEEWPESGIRELEKEAQRCQRELSELQRCGDTLAPLRMEQLLTLARGRLALFRGESEQAAELLGRLSGMATERSAALMLRSCALLGADACYRQLPALAERYISTGVRLLGRSPDRLQQALFQRLRGNCFCLQGAYDKSLYYLQEAMETLENLPHTSAVRLQLTAALCDMGKVSRVLGKYAEACGYFKRALALLEEGYWPGSLWIYVHYGRTAFVLEDHGRARELFARGYEIYRRHGELWGGCAAAAFTAYYEQLDGNTAAAVAALQDARNCAEKMDSPLEKTILAFVSMHMRARLDGMREEGSALEALLPWPAESYARLGIRANGSIPDVFEAEALSRSLRDGIHSQQRYRASELYSKNRHFMAE